MRKLFLLLIILCVAVSIFIFFPNNNKKVSSIPSIISSDCSIEKSSCFVFLPSNEKVKFNLEPKGLPVMEPLRLSIDGLRVAHNSVKVWFEGRDMNMGRHYLLPLTDNDDSKVGSRFQGMIPVCSLDKGMIWLLTVEFTFQQQVLQVQFQVQTNIISD